MSAVITGSKAERTPRLPGAAGTHPETLQARRTIGGYIWFALMVAGWVAFFTLAAFSDGILAGLYDDLRALPLILELVVWFLTFPFALGLTVWESSWDPASRLALVAGISLAWSAMFFPRKRP